MILVTGASGFVGSYLVRYLVEAGEEVRGLKHKDSDLSLLGKAAKMVEWVDGDVNDIGSLKIAMEGVDMVYHFAGYISFQSKDNKKLLKVNAEGTANVVNMCLDMGVGKLLYISSVAALGKGKTNELLDESEENIDSDIDTTYGLSKCLGEMEVWRGMMEGLRAVIINPAMIIGAGYWGNHFLAAFPYIEKGMPFYATGSTGFVDVRDVARIAMMLMDSPIHNERFIVAAENRTYGDIANQIADNLGVKRPNIVYAPWMTLLGTTTAAILASIKGQRAVFTRQNAKLFRTKYQYNNHKLVERLDYQYIPVEQSIKEAAEAYKASKAEGKGFAILPL